MPATNWTELSMASATAYDSGFYTGVIADYVIIGGAAIPVDADGNPVTPVGVTTWTQLSLASATPATELSGVLTPYTELTL